MRDLKRDSLLLGGFFCLRLRRLLNPSFDDWLSAINDKKLESIETQNAQLLPLSTLLKSRVSRSLFLLLYPEVLSSRDTESRPAKFLLPPILGSDRRLFMPPLRRPLNSPPRPWYSSSPSFVRRLFPPNREKF